MEDIVLLNESIKLKKFLEENSGGGALGGRSTQVAPVASAKLVITNSSNYNANTSTYVESSSSYRRIFNHGGGQFSANSVHYNPNQNAAQQYCLPFTVDQTTGAITQGTGTAIFNGSSNIDTGNWAVAGDLAMRVGTSGSNGNFCSGWRVSGNTVVNSQTSTSNAAYNQSMSNYDGNWSRSGGTMYFSPTTYYTPSGTASDVVWSYNTGNSLSNTIANSPTSDTSTNYRWPVVPQLNAYPSYMGLWAYRNGSSYVQLRLQNQTGGDVTTVNASQFGWRSNAIVPGQGFQLSNGNIIYQTQAYQGMSILQSGNSLSRMTTGDTIPGYKYGTVSKYFPVGVDTWVTITQNPHSEIVKFSIDPSTYAVTIIESIPLSRYFPSQYDDGNEDLSTGQSGGVWLTGSSNQFMVVPTVTSQMPIAYVHVYPTPFTT